MKLFIFPTSIALAALLGIFWWGGPQAFILALLLSVLEVTLSFDNAVVNAKVLTGMTPLWQKRFLTWGMVFAVFGTRLVLPAVIVGFAAMMSPVAAAFLALRDPVQYAIILKDAAPIIESFGGAFLLMVSLKYFFDVEKQTHWLHLIESRLSQWGRIEAIEIGLALITIVTLSSLAHHGEPGGIIAAGCIGIILFIAIQGLASMFQTGELHGGATLGAAAKGGVALFVYLNILDAAFSLDGVVGAFAITTIIPVIFVGLGIGAYFVRTITVYLVEKKTLDTLVYLEHGAHWAIFGLAFSMFASLVIDVPEVVTGLIGLVFVGASYYSSRRELQQSLVI